MFKKIKLVISFTFKKWKFEYQLEKFEVVKPQKVVE